MERNVEHYIEENFRRQTKLKRMGINWKGAGHVRRMMIANKSWREILKLVCWHMDISLENMADKIRRQRAINQNKEGMLADIKCWNKNK